MKETERKLAKGKSAKRHEPSEAASSPALAPSMNGKYRMANQETKKKLRDEEELSSEAEVERNLDTEEIREQKSKTRKPKSRKRKSTEDSEDEWTNARLCLKNRKRAKAK